MDMIKTGDFLRSLRKAKGLTQEDVATRLMLSPKTISRWESGLGLPDISIITDVATLYDVTVDEILKGQRNSKNLKEETEKSNDKKVNNILTNKITSKFNIYFYVAIGILSAFLVTEVILGLLVNSIVAIVLMALGFIISINLIIFGNIDIKMHYSSVEEPNEVNNAYIHSLKFIRVKNLLFYDIVFIAFELNLIYLGFLFNIVDSGLICSLISLFAITISAYLIIRIFLIKNTIKENKEGFRKRLGIIASIFSIIAIIIFIVINFGEKSPSIHGSIESYSQFDLWLLLMFYNNKAMKYLWRIISALIFILAIVEILFGALKKKYLLSSILTVIGGVSPFLSTIDYYMADYKPYVGITVYIVDFMVNPFGIIYMIIALSIFIYLYVTGYKRKIITIFKAFSGAFLFVL